jgi:predicted Holliday junction resolvase-like endonuclease
MNMLVFWTIFIMILLFLFPVFMLIVYQIKATRLKEKQDREWRELYNQIKDDSETLRAYQALSLLR